MNIENIKKAFQEGMKIQLIRMKGEPQMPFGLIGTVVAVDDIGQVHMKWENGSSLALDTGVDSFKVIS